MAGLNSYEEDYESSCVTCQEPKDFSERERVSVDHVAGE